MQFIKKPNVLSKFILVGGSATLIQFLLLALFIEMEFFSPVTATALSYSISAVFNYVASYFYTFEAKSEHHTAILKFLGMNAIGLSVNTITFYLFDHYVFEHYFYSQLLATICVITINFVLSKFWVFR